MLNDSDHNQNRQEVVLANKEQLLLCSDVLAQLNSHSYLDNIIKPVNSFEKKDLVLYRIEEITYEEDSPRLEALENAISCMSVPGVNLVYLILGDKKTSGVQFYFGFSYDAVALKEATDSMKELGRAFIKPALDGNFRGSTIKEVASDEIDKIHRVVSEFVSKNCKTLSGVPGWDKDKEQQDFRGIDRLVDVMHGDDFGLLIIAKPLESDNILNLRKDVFSTYGLLSAISKHSVQLGFNTGNNKNISVNTGLNITAGETLTVTTNRGESKTEGHSKSYGDRHGNSSGNTSSTAITAGRSEGTSTNISRSENIGQNVGVGYQHGASITTSYDFTDKSAAEWVKYFDEVLIPRLDYARGKGAFVVNTVLFGDNPQVVHKLSNVARSIFSGETANMVPLMLSETEEREKDYISMFSLPCGQITEQMESRLPYIHAGLLRYSDDVKIQKEIQKVLYSGNWMSVRELALMAGLPQKEVIGLRLKKEVEFGLNILEDKNQSESTQINLGNLVKSGIECRGASVHLDKGQLDRHIFIAGVTGSGKTTTCQTLLLSSGWPFMVIEPAKTEYRALRYSSYPEGHAKAGQIICPDLLVFTLGDDTVAPFRLNPFELIPGESITSRIDMLMASITAAFDMEAAIPQLIERAIYACYEDYGWSIETNQNKYYKNYSIEDKDNYEGTPFADGVFAFPTLSEILKKTEDVVQEQGFDERLKKDYIGSIKARLQGLTLGSKGFMLNCQRSVDFMSLLDKQVVLELEPIPSAAQKSLIIGFILTSLLQAIKKKFYDNGGRKINHITLIEEAHRLLSKPEPGGNQSQKQATDTFADMLAEIRKYGESLVIADQIPGKLTPEVIKNTNTKIIHRLFAKDDKDAVGHTMGLEEEQANFLSNLLPGRAIIFNGNWPKAVQVQIAKIFDTSSTIVSSEITKIHEASMKYYSEQYRRGEYAYSEFFDTVPKNHELKEQADISKKITKELAFIPNDKYDRKDFPALSKLVKKYRIERVIECIEKRFYYTKLSPQIVSCYKQFFSILIDDNIDFSESKKIRNQLDLCGKAGLKPILHKSSTQQRS